MQTFKLVPAGPEHMKEVFELSNDPVVRANSIQQEKISWDNHVAWYTKAISDAKLCFLVVVASDNRFLGQVRIRLEETNKAIISISIAREIRGMSLSSEILNRACDFFFTNYSRGISIFAQIQAENQASIRAFSKAFFSEDEKFTLKGVPYISMKRGHEVNNSETI